jgi:hypothetical protein
MTENLSEADLESAEMTEYEEDVIAVGVPKAFTNFLICGSYLRQALMHNLYFSEIIMFVCALSFEEKDLHHLMWF